MDGKSATLFAVVISQHDAAAWLVSISCDRAIIMWPVAIGRSMSQKWETLSRRIWYILHETAGNSYTAQHRSGEINSLDETCSSIKRSLLKAVCPNYETPIFFCAGANSLAGGKTSNEMWGLRPEMPLPPGMDVKAAFLIYYAGRMGLHWRLLLWLFPAQIH